MVGGFVAVIFLSAIIFYLFGKRTASSPLGQHGVPSNANLPNDSGKSLEEGIVPVALRYPDFSRDGGPFAANLGTHGHGNVGARLSKQSY